MKLASKNQQFEDLEKVGKIEDQRVNYKDIFVAFSLKNILEQMNNDDLKVSTKYISKQKIL